jgi:hypothetical protein
MQSRATMQHCQDVWLAKARMQAVDTACWCLLTPVAKRLCSAVLCCLIYSQWQRQLLHRRKGQTTGFSHTYWVGGVGDGGVGAGGAAGHWHHWIGSRRGGNRHWHRRWVGHLFDKATDAEAAARAAASQCVVDPAVSGPPNMCVWSRDVCVECPAYKLTSSSHQVPNSCQKGARDRQQQWTLM